MTAERETGLQRVLRVFIATGLAFMLVPGTFLGVWNLLSITADKGPGALDPAWIQAHGHAQIFGWIGSFILGIGFYSLTKMGPVADFALWRAWASWALWTAGAAMRWAANVSGWHWRALVPLSAALECAGFLLFVLTVSRHRSEPERKPSGSRAWMALVMAGSAGFLLSAFANLAVACHAAWTGSPAVPHALNQKLLVLFTWGFPVLMIWGFSARWLPVFLGLQQPLARWLYLALGLDAAGVALSGVGRWHAATFALLAASASACAGVRLFAAGARPAKTKGVHPSFPAFVKLAYAWLLVSALIAVLATFYDTSGGLWGASRHAITVGFISTMVFAIGQRVLPGFSGMRVLFSPRLMFAGLALLNAGCAIRVAAEIGAYENLFPALWPALPVSAVIEMTAVTVFAVNLAVTLRSRPPHEAILEAAGLERPR